LTNYSEPNGCQGPAQARGNAVLFITECVKKGIKVAVSSAWPDFSATIQRLKDLGLGDILEIMTGDIQEGEEDLFEMSVQYARLGYVASVKSKGSSEYRLKGLAYYYIYPGLDLKATKHWVLGDDNNGNVSLFKECLFDIYRKSQIAKEALPGGIFVKMFCLSAARGEATLK
jgi:hypothetical protein